MEINQNTSKTIIMANEEKKHKIIINGQILEQMQYYKYYIYIGTIIEYNEKVDLDITERTGIVVSITSNF